MTNFFPVVVCLCLCRCPVEEPRLWGAPDAPECLGSHDGAWDWGAPTALHRQEAAHPGCNGCQEEKTTELLSVSSLSPSCPGLSFKATITTKPTSCCLGGTRTPLLSWPSLGDYTAEGGKMNFPFYQTKFPSLGKPSGNHHRKGQLPWQPGQHFT